MTWLDLEMKTTLQSKSGDSNSRHKLALWFTALVTLVVSPGLTFDPINVPKFLILGLGLIVLSVSLKNSFESSNLKNHGMTLFFSLVFLCAIVLSTFVADSNLSTKIFGSPGRQTGLISYSLLALTLVVFAFLSNGDLIDKLNFLIIQLGILLSVYGILQYLDLEILPYGGAYGSAVFGTFGNSNFLSAFLGMAGVVGFLTIWNLSYKKIIRVLGAISFIFSNITIFLSNSQQGYFIMAAGIGIGLIILLSYQGMRRVALIGLLAYLSGAVLAVLAFFNKGPFASMVYQSTLGLRKEYWFAAIHTINREKLFGVGLDNFGSYYRRTRSLEVINQNPDVVTDSAHNVFLDIGSGAGLIAMVSYVLLIIYVFSKIYSVIRSRDSYDFGYLILIAVWISYLAQAFISINNLGLAIWGWVIPGLLVGYRSIEKSAPNKSLESKSKGAVMTTRGNRNLLLARLIIGLVLFLGAFTTPTFVSSVKFYSSLKTGDPEVIKNSAYLFPDDLNRYIYVATALKNNQFEIDSRDVIRIGVEKFPDSFELWRLFSSLKIATDYEIRTSKSEMKRLDPNNPNLK
jgi:O-antigen ligase